MSRNIIILFLFVAILLIIFVGFFLTPKNSSNSNNLQLSGSSQVISGPSIVVDPVSHDFGEVVYGDVVKHIFTVRNIGNEPLEILRLSTSCGCTSAFIEEKDMIVGPGESVEMIVSFDPAVHKDDSDIGQLTRIVYIKTNDSGKPEIEATITANVIKNN